MKKENNDEIVIRSLSDCDAVRTRPGMYVGAVNNPDLIFREVIDGSFDESYATGCNNIIISTCLNGYYFVADNGRGIPITMSIDDPTKTQAYLAIAKLHAGANFNTAGIRAGMHGCGEAAANFLSERFIVMSKITEDNYNKSIPPVQKVWETSGPRIRKDLFYIAMFSKGNLVYEGAGRRSDAEKLIFADEFKGGYQELPEGMSTMILFRPDPTIFDSVKAEIPVSNLQNFLLIQEKYYGRKVSLWVDGTVMTSSGFKPYTYEFIKTIVPKDTSLNDKVTIYVTFEFDKGLGNKVESGSVNGLTVNQGIHINWVESYYEEALRQEYKIKHKCIFQGLKIHVLLLAGEVLYDSQTKTRLRSISKVKIEDLKTNIIKEFIKIFHKYSDEWGSHVNRLNLLADSMRSISAVEKAQRMIEGNSGSSFYKNKSGLVDGFADATAKNRWDCELFLCEGLSPAGSLKSGRRPVNGEMRIAVCPLKGKILNVSDASIDKALDNKEINTIFTLLGVGIQENNVTSGCKTLQEAKEALMRYSRYGKICISCDADSDGSQITSLILYMFSKFARFLIDAGCIYISLSPLFEQGGKYYYPNDPIDRSTGLPLGIDSSKPFRRWKGLGSIPKELIYDAFFNPATRRLIQVTPEGIEYAMQLTEDINARKSLLREAGILTNPYNFIDL